MPSSKMETFLDTDLTVRRPEDAFATAFSPDVETAFLSYRECHLVETIPKPEFGVRFIALGVSLIDFSSGFLLGIGCHEAEHLLF